MLMISKLIRNYYLVLLFTMSTVAMFNTQASEGRVYLSQQEVEALGLNQGVSMTREAAGIITESIKASEPDTREQQLDRYVRAREALERYNALVTLQEAETLVRPLAVDTPEAAPRVKE